MAEMRERRLTDRRTHRHGGDRDSLLSAAANTILETGEQVVSSIDRIRQQKRTMIARHVGTDNGRGFTQILTTLVPLAALWYAAALAAEVSVWLVVGLTLMMSMFLLRVFVLMHDCGHGSLFRSGRLNRSFGFLLGVLSGMPQYVWSQHHAHHHSSNGDWEKYRGPLNIASVCEYEAMTDAQRRRYRRARSIWLAPLAGFVYLVFNPRVTWIKGSIALVRHLIKRKIAEPGTSIKAHAAEFRTRYWNSPQEYWHMFWNNVVLLCAWGAMCWGIDAALFFPIYHVSVSLAGAAGIVLFTVQHNFEHAYASETAGWDYDIAAIRGTSYLILPRWLNWFTADIAYHHIHHLSARIPNYRLAACHEEYKELFSEVTRVRLSQVHGAIKCILWDRPARRIISVAEYERQREVAAYA